ncbi:hypothetical protein BLAT2472_20676 [Burkholderia latens]
MRAWPDRRRRRTPPLPNRLSSLHLTYPAPQTSIQFPLIVANRLSRDTTATAFGFSSDFGRHARAAGRPMTLCMPALPANGTRSAYARLTRTMPRGRAV